MSSTTVLSGWITSLRTLRSFAASRRKNWISSWESSIDPEYTIASGGRMGHPRPHPRVFARGLKQRLDHRHVPYRIVEWRGHVSPPPDRLREQVTLNRVLIAQRKILGSDSAAVEIRAVIDRDP